MILVDDSIVRGTTSRKIVRMVRQAGAREVHMPISCPPTISPCFHGVDTPNKSDSSPQTAPLKRFDVSLRPTRWRISLRALRESVGDERHEYCYARYTGDYPTELTDNNRLVSIKMK